MLHKTLGMRDRKGISLVKADEDVSKFSGRHNISNADTADQMAIIASQSVGKRLRFQDLIGRATRR